MSLAYVPPGVTVEELTSTAVAPLIAVPGSVCLVGLASGGITQTDSITLTRGTPVVLPGAPAGSSMTSGSILLVTDAVTPSLAPTGYSSTYAYSFNSTNRTIARLITSTTLSGSATSAQANFTLTAVANVTSVTTTTGSLTATVSSGGFPNVTFGMGVSGSNIATGTTVVSVASNTLTLSIAATGSGSATLSFTDVPLVGQTVRLESAGVTVASVTTAASSYQATVASGGFPSVSVGQTVTGTGITPGTVVQSIVGNTLVLNQAASASGTVTLTFTTTELVIVQGVASQVVTATTNLVNSYSGGAAASWGAIPDGNTVYVQYTYTPADYFAPIRLNSMRDIQNRFGNAWDSTNTVINTPLSYAASLVFQNGATNVVLQPLYQLVNNLPAAPAASGTGSNSDANVWSEVFNGLTALEDINILVPVVGQSQSGVTDNVQLQIEQAAQDFAYGMITNNNIYVEVVMGEDSSQSSSVAQEATLQAHAQTLTPRHNGIVTEQCVLVNTSQFAVANVSSSVLVGGQYVAAAVAGLLAANSPATTITRIPLSGILAVTDSRTASGKISDAANGLLVVENKGQIVQVRHGITLDDTSAATRELNVVRAKQFIIESVRQTLDTQIIGKVSADADAPTIVNNVVIGTLEELLGLSQLSGYANVQSAITSLDPTTMAVSFDYAPLFTINYINIQFALDLTANSVLVTANGVTS